MKVRIGIGASAASLSPERIEGLCAGLGEHGFDSIWIPEVLTQPGIDPLVGLAWLAGRLPSLKIGTTFLVPGRNVLRLARQLATLDHLSAGRLLLTAVPGLAQGGERVAVGPLPRERGRAMDEGLVTLRRLLAGERVDIEMPAGTVEGVEIDPLPAQQPLEIWLGGNLPSALERCGRLADGWLPAMLTPEEAAEGRRAIEGAAAAAGRRIDPEHYGVSIGYSRVPLPAWAQEAVARRARRDDALELVPQDLDALRRQVESFVEVGFSKFVVRPLARPGSWRGELEALADAVLDLQT